MGRGLFKHFPIGGHFRRSVVTLMFSQRLTIFNQCPTEFNSYHLLSTYEVQGIQREIITFNVNSCERQVLPLSHFTDGESEVQRGAIICLRLRLHSL